MSKPRSFRTAIRVKAPWRRTGPEQAAGQPTSRAELRRRGDAERDQANWPSSAYYYSRLLRLEPDDAGLWLQHGHVLKETGLLAEAGISYGVAKSLRPDDPEVYLQLAILAKLQCHFNEAATLYDRAASLGYQPAQFIVEELGFLRRTGRVQLSQAATSAEAIIYLSSIALPLLEQDPAQLKLALGAANYSYAFVMKGYQDTLESAGYTCKVIRNPEFLPEIVNGPGAGPILHIGFYPPDAPRYLKGAHNIMCIAWEFGRLKMGIETPSYHAFSDPVIMLSRAQEVWAISSFGAEAAERSGVPSVSAVPTPIPAMLSAGRSAKPGLTAMQRLAMSLDRINWVPLAIWPVMQSTLSGQSSDRRSAMLNIMLDADDDLPPTFFLCIFNVHDYRKQMKPAIEAFIEFSQAHPDAYFLLKISSINSDKQDINGTLFVEQISDIGEMTPPLVSNRVLITTDALSRAEMNLLYDISAFYICTSHAEGQNLPLIEAMSHGVVPISADHTAMRDYISAENAIVIPSTYGPLTKRLTLRYGMYGVGTYYISMDDVLLSLRKAQTMSDAAYAHLSTEGVKTVIQKFGVTSFTSAVRLTIERAAGLANKNQEV